MTQARPVGRFPARQRVRKRPEFQQIQAEGRRVTTPHFTLLLRARGEASPATGARLGITVSRRVGHAPIRSRSKRLVREAFRATRDLWEDCMDLVVIVRGGVAQLGLAEVVAEWRQFSKQIARRTREAEKDREKRASALAERA